jgi:hypothetical protein
MCQRRITVINGGIKRNDLFIMSHPEFREGIIARNDALLRSIPVEPPNTKRYNFIKTFGAIYYNPIYDRQTTPGPQEWKKELDKLSDSI